MKSLKFRKGISTKDKIIITVVFSMALSIYIILKFSSAVSEEIINTADALIKRENTLLFKKAFGNKSRAGVDIYDLITVQKNSKEEIVEVDFKISECEKMMMTIIEDMNDGTNMISTDGYILDIPLGYVTNSPLLLNLGPKIPVKITTTDVALGEVTTEIREFGINNVLIELYISIEIETNAILPLKSGATKQTYKALIASKIINGTVPSLYSGYISRESNAISLPIN